jgi:hypothetical protein
MEALAAKITSPLSLETIQADAVNKIIQGQKETAEHYNFFVPDTLKETLTNHGLPIALYSANLHDHPAHKIIENNMLFDQLAHYIKEDTTVMFMKKKPKFNHFQKKVKKLNGENIHLELINKRIDSRDHSRYAKETLGSATNLKHSSLVIHDCLHYLTGPDIALLFERNPKLMDVYATTIIPPETYKKYPSLYPALYELYYKGDTVIYVPEGHHAGKYEQPLSALYWLNTNYIVTSGFSLTVTLIQTKFSHHLIKISKRPGLCAKFNTFKTPDSVKIPKVYRKELNIKNPYLPRKLVYNTLMYTKAVNKAQERDLFAKLRALIASGNPDKLELPALALLVDAALILKENSWTYNQTPRVTTSLTSALWNKTIGLIKDVTINKLYQKLYLSFLTVLDFEQMEFTFTLEADHVQPYELERAATSLLFQGAPKFLPFERKPASQFINKLLDKHQLNQESFMRCFSWYNFCHPERSSDIPIQTFRSTNNEIRDLNNLLSEFTEMNLDTFLTDPELIKVQSDIQIKSKDSRTPVDETQSISSQVQEIIVAENPEVTDLLNASNTCGLQVYRNVRTDTQIFRAYINLRCSRDRFSKTDAPNLHSTYSTDNFEMMSAVEVVALGEELGLEVALHQGSMNDLGQMVWSCENLVTDAVHIYNSNIHWQNSPILHRCATLTDLSDSEKQEAILREIAKIAETIYPSKSNKTGGKSIKRLPELADLSEVPKINEPINFTKALGYTMTELKDFEDKLVASGAKIPESIMTTPSRARCYLSALKAKTTGLLLSGEKMEGLVLRLDKMAKNLPPRKVQIVLHLGKYGSGKTQQLRDIFHKQDPERRRIKVITPLQDLRKEWLKESNQPIDSVLTFERAFLSPGSDILFIDEFTKLPPGYLEAYLLHSPRTTKVYLIGDPLQCHFHDSNRLSTLNKTMSEASFYFNLYSHYLNFTFRLAIGVADYLGVKTYSEREGRIIQRPFLDSSLTTLTPDGSSAEKLSDVSNTTFTYSGSQGQNFKGDYQVLINKYAAYASPATLEVALSRGERNVFVVLQDPINPGTELKINANPALKCLLTHIRNQPAPNISLEEPEVKEPEPPITHLAPENQTALEETILQESLAKEDKEVFTPKYGNTQQFNDQLSHYENVFMRHQNKDEATCEITWDKRIITSSVKENLKELQESKPIGSALFLSFQKCMNLPKQQQVFDWDLFLTKIAENEKVKLSKTLNMLVNNRGRADPDVAPERINLFLKSQTCTKLEKINSMAKAGQSISCFQDLPIMILGPVARYLEEMVNLYKPDNIHIHTRMSPYKLDSFINRHWNFSKISNENDFTAFDQSQNGEFLNFEIYLMKLFGIPRQFIDFYVQIKVQARVFKGVLSIMRLTGEFCTFLFNTYGNIAYTHTKYAIGPSVAQVYGGDDSAINDKPEFRVGWAKQAAKFKLVSKEVYSYRPTFCGWYLTKCGIIKSPLLLYLKLQLQKSRKNLGNCLDSYLEDHKFAYSQADNLHEVLDEQEMGFMQLTNRFFIENGKTLPPNILY